MNALVLSNFVHKGISMVLKDSTQFWTGFLNDKLNLGDVVILKEYKLLFYTAHFLGRHFP